jgi:hypothetical protein
MSPEDRARFEILGSNLSRDFTVALVAGITVLEPLPIQNADGSWPQFAFTNPKNQQFFQNWLHAGEVGLAFYEGAEAMKAGIWAVSGGVPPINSSGDAQSALGKAAAALIAALMQGVTAATPLTKAAAVAAVSAGLVNNAGLGAVSQQIIAAVNGAPAISTYQDLVNIIQGLFMATKPPAPTGGTPPLAPNP